ncbi:MAG: Bug family tripartite tricarboxylate transporter substrate binding protein, partial [Xanthobacteraceae bacterium]
DSRWGGGAWAQRESYPTRPVRIIVDSAPGSAIDVTLRIIADRLGQLWGQQVLPINQPGGGGAISARAAAEAAPDGYTLYQPALSIFLATPGRAAHLPLELPRDFAPIGSISEQPMFIAVPPSLGVNNLSELIALAKQRPGQITYATTGVGRITHLAGELLQLRTGIKLQLVPYSGGPSHSLNDILGGRVQVIIEAYPGMAGPVQAGAIKPIAVASAQRLPAFPDLPTVAETVPGFLATGWQGLAAPNGTPDTIVSKISSDLRTVLDEDEVKKQIAARGGYIRPMSPSEVIAFIQEQQRTWNPILERLFPK